ncbi:MAG: TonB family protein [bacterium F082]|nr:MAG: TonB family protein [bacterium F082]KWW28823.1 MAG: TonB family protein [bacterium P201]
MKAQELIIGHLLPIAATVAVLWLVYRLLFRNSNRLHFNRFFLLTSMLLALVMPLLGLLSGIEVPQMATLKQQLFNGIMLNEVIVTPDGQPVLPEVTVTTNATPSRFSVWQVIGGIYLLGVSVMTLLFLIKLGRLVVLIIRSPKRKMDGFTAVYLSAVPEPVEGPQRGSFSFFRYAFFPNENVDPDILRHEISHIEHHHSWDILFAEVMMILQWFNPFIYLYKKELQSLHEYQADRDVVATGVDKKNYMMLILQQCTAVDFSGMSNNFSLILTKKRIKMITKNEKAKGLWWRLLATLPVLAILLIANTKVTAQDASTKLGNQAVDKPITVEMGQFEIFDDDGTPMQLKDTLIYSDDGSYIKFETSDGFQPESGEPCKKLTVTSYDADGTQRNNFFITETERRGDTSTYSIETFSISGSLFETLLDVATSTKDTVYQIVEQMPQYTGGEEAMMKYVAENIKYPQAAKDKNIGGRVFVSFVIEKDGSVNEVKVMRGIGGGCDEEAVRVIKGMPKWKPGMQKGKPVRVNYMMPINFKLSDDQPEKPAQQTDANKPNMKPDKNGVYQICEQMPEFPGGVEALMDFVAKNVVYPQEAMDKEISGRVYVSFVIEKDGSVNEVKVMKGIGGGCDDEAVRVIKAMPKWKPGKQDGKPVRVSYMMPITFKLQ